MGSFGDFIDKKTRRAKKELSTIGKVLTMDGFKVENYLEEEDPYLFVNTTEDALPFDGVRIYKVGSNIAYRIQKENKTQPYGMAYSLNIEEMFEDLISDTNEQKAGEEIIEAISKEFRKFFKKSLEAEQEIKSLQFNPASDPGNKLTAMGNNNDYANMITNGTRTYSPL